MTIGKLSGQCDFGQKGQSYCNQRGQSCVAKRVKVAWLFHHGLVCGMDYSPTCVDIASRKNKAAISQGRASIIEANVSNIPFDDNRFDIVTAFETIYFWNDIVENFKEVLRVLKPEGRFYICNEACSEEGNEKWVRNIDLRIYSPIEIQRMLEQAGFINVTYDISPESQSQRICVQATKQPMMKPIDR